MQSQVSNDHPINMQRVFTSQTKRKQLSQHIRDHSANRLFSASLCPPVVLSLTYLNKKLSLRIVPTVHLRVTRHFAAQSATLAHSLDHSREESSSVPEVLRHPSQVYRHIVHQHVEVLLFGVAVAGGRVHIGSLVAQDELEHLGLDVADQGRQAIRALGDLLADADCVVQFLAHFQSCLLEYLQVLIFFVVIVALLYQLAEQEVEQWQRRLLYHNYYMPTYSNPRSSNDEHQVLLPSFPLPIQKSQSLQHPLKLDRAQQKNRTQSKLVRVFQYPTNPQKYWGSPLPPHKKKPASLEHQLLTRVRIKQHSLSIKEYVKKSQQRESIGFQQKIQYLGLSLRNKTEESKERMDAPKQGMEHMVRTKTEGVREETQGEGRKQMEQGSRGLRRQVSKGRTMQLRGNSRQRMRTQDGKGKMSMINMSFAGREFVARQPWIKHVK